MWGVALPAAAQDEGALRAALEGQRVTLKIDMPGTQEGVDLKIDSRSPMDYGEYRDRLKRYGTAIRAGESAMVTVVKLKKDSIEFQLDGGGYGTFGDDTSTSVYMPLVEPSKRERELDHLIKDEPDRRRRHELEDERDHLRERRERENRRIEVARADAEARKADQLAARRQAGGSRFNLHYNGSVPAGIRPSEVMAALDAYVDFSRGPASFGDTPGRPPAPGFGDAGPGRGAPSFGDDAPPAGDVAPRKGMTRAEAESAFGRPVQTSERREGSVTVTTLVFEGRDQRITADFVEGVLVRYATSSR